MHWHWEVISSNFQTRSVEDWQKSWCQLLFLSGGAKDCWTWCLKICFMWHTKEKKKLKKGRVSWPWIQEILSFNIASIACYGIWHGIHCQKFYDSLKRVLQHIMVPYSATSLTRDVQINRHFIFGICDIIKSRFGFWLDTNTKGIQLVGTAGKQLRCFGGIEDVLEDVTERYA